MGNIKKGLLQGVPMLARMVERETSESFDLTNNISIEVHTASFRSTRGYTIVAALLDELAFWRGEEFNRPRHRGHQCDPTGHEHHPKRHAAVFEFALRKAWSFVGGTSQTLR